MQETYEALYVPNNLTYCVADSTWHNEKYGQIPNEFHFFQQYIIVSGDQTQICL